MAHELYGDAVTSEGSEQASIQLTVGAQEETFEVIPEDTSVDKAPEEKPDETQEGDPNEESTEDQQEPPKDKAPEEVLQADVETLKTSEAEIAKDLAAKGVDFNAIAQEFADTGKLTDETLSSLDKAGYPKITVDAFLAGREAVEQRFAQQVYAQVGGEEQFLALRDFAATNLNAQEIASFDRAIESDDIGVIGLMLKGIQAKYTSKHGTKGKAVVGATTGTPKAVGFKDNSEMVKAMSDKRYGRDAAYTNEVILKVAASNN
ncbi:hypothetical protein FW800_25670 [Pseudomonas sp. 910_23]|uniref:capsid assembly protein n=1 Tax=Pseudomonas sp. 910_23 TaxID=2604461 RepID=UPI0040637309